MAVTIYPARVKLFLLTWQHHHLMIVSITVSIIQQGMSGKDPRLDASLLRCTLSSSLASSLLIDRRPSAISAASVAVIDTRPIVTTYKTNTGKTGAVPLTGDYPCVS